MSDNKINIFYGLLVSALLAVISQLASSYAGVYLFGFKKSPISPILIALVFGIVLGNKFDFQTKYGPGINFCIKYVLKFGIILMGIRLGLMDLLGFGMKSLLVVFPCILISLLISKKIANLFKIESGLASLIAVGTSICGASAIIAFSSTIPAKKNEVVFAIANITVFGIFAMFFYPLAAKLLFQEDFISSGIFLGGSIHETAQVAGAGLIYAQQYSQPQVLEIATLTKLIRNTAMVFVIPYMAFKQNYISSSQSLMRHIKSIFPIFILGFIGLGILRTIGDLGINDFGLAYGILDSEKWTTLISYITEISKFFLIMAMASIGLSTNIETIKSVKINIFGYGLFMSLIVGLLSLFLIFLIT